MVLPSIHSRQRHHFPADEDYFGRRDKKAMEHAKRLEQKLIALYLQDLKAGKRLIGGNNLTLLGHQLLSKNLSRINTPR